VKLIDNFDASYEYLTNEGTVFTFKTNKDAPKYRVINIDLDKPDPSDWKALIPEQETDVLEDAVCVRGNRLIVVYMQDVKVTFATG
jgi:prolyl oligopeptidase